MIHPTAVIHPGAMIADDVTIGAYSVIGGNVTIGAGCEIGPHVVIEGHTTLGCGVRISQFASIGAAPQDLSYRGEDTTVVIGDRVNIREYVTVHRGTYKGKKSTVIGDDSYLMAYCQSEHK